MYTAISDVERVPFIIRKETRGRLPPTVLMDNFFVDPEGAVACRVRLKIGCACITFSFLFFVWSVTLPFTLVLLALLARLVCMASKHISGIAVVRRFRPLAGTRINLWKGRKGGNK